MRSGLFHPRSDFALARRKQALLARSAVLRRQCAVQAEVLLKPACAWGDRAGRLMQGVKGHPWLAAGAVVGLLALCRRVAPRGGGGALRTLLEAWALARRWGPWGLMVWRAMAGTNSGPQPEPTDGCEPGQGWAADGAGLEGRKPTVG